MRTYRYLIAAAALLATVNVARPSGGDEDATARAILAKAIKAHGGEENLAKIKALSLKGSGNVYVANDTYPFTAEWQIQGTTQQKFVVNITFNGMNIFFAKVVNGDKGWLKMGAGEATDLNKDDLADAQHELYAGNLQKLVPLKDKGFKLAPLGEVKVNDHEAVGICVSKKGHADVNLYFDKKTHLLVKAETRTRDQGNEVNEETYFSGYKMTGGVQQAYKLTIMHDGKRFVEGELSEVVVHTDRLDDSIFAKP